MISKTGSVAKLRGIGLTETEAQVYIALLKGNADAKPLSKTSGVPYSKIHTVLSKLVKKSLVVELEGRPAIYAAKKVKEGLDDYRRAVLSEMEKGMKEAEKELAAIQEPVEDERSDIWILKSKEGVLNKAYDVMSGARSEIKFALPAVPGWVMTTVVPVLTRLSAGKISLRMLLSASTQREDLERLSKFGEVRIRDEMFGGGMITDDREAVLFLASEGMMPSLAIWSNNAGLVNVATTYFGSLWDSSRRF